MSNQLRATEAVMADIREEAIHRANRRTTKQLARVIAEKHGVHLAASYVGKLVAIEIRKRQTSQED